MKCPKCNEEMKYEDNRADTDYGVCGSIIYFCDGCNIKYDEFGSELENE